MCPWYRRWYHQRQRCADTAFYAQLVAKSPTMHEARRAWDLFLELPGQEHWSCPCGEEVAAIFRAVNFQLEADPE